MKLNICIDNQYVDCTKYAETPVATLKSLFKYWAATAAWYHPSILVLDNLDKMLPAEQEVRILYFPRPNHLTEPKASMPLPSVHATCPHSSCVSLGQSH
jgi:hypothetical protein